MSQYSNEEIVQVTGTVIVDGSASTQPVSAVSLPLPTGASTSANQVTEIASLASIDTKTLAPGQATMANSSPVVIASNQSAVPVSGPLTDTQLRATPVPVSGPLTDTQLRATPVPVTFSSAATTPTVTSVSVSTTVATLAAANPARQKLIIFNESGTLFVKLGTGATGSDYTYRLTANTLLEIDFAQTSAVTAIKASGTSNCQVTSLA